MQVANTVSFTPAVVMPHGKTKIQRQLSVVNDASTQAKLALANAKGKVGQAARMGVAMTGLKAIAGAAAKNNYLPTAQYFAARLGQPFIISSRAAFESMPDVFEAMIMKAQMSKNGGYTECKKTGAQKPTAAMALAMELKAIAIELIAEKEAIRQTESAPALTIAA